jgi:hypothetical protein
MDTPKKYLRNLHRDFKLIGIGLPVNSERKKALPNTSERLV